LPEILVRGIRVGGVTDCVSAAMVHGLATIATPTLHVSVPTKATQLRSPSDARVRLAPGATGVLVHWSPGSRRGVVVQDAPNALLMMATCQSPERTVAALDSAIRARHLSAEDWRRITERLPARLRALVREVDSGAESITESLVRFRLRRLGYAPRTQVQIRGVGRVDLLLGSRLVIELDGWEYHGDRDQFERDRQRDARLAARGFRVLRFSYRQVMSHWGECRTAVTGALEAEAESARRRNHG
jgi:very-short-patch-repair endonuclease